MAYFGENFIHAWCNANHDSVSVRDSYNISSITDNGTGRMKFNFSTNANNTTYVFSGIAGNQTGTTTVGRILMNDAAVNVAHFSIRYRSVSTVLDDNLVSVICVAEN